MKINKFNIFQILSIYRKIEKNIENRNDKYLNYV